MTGFNGQKVSFSEYYQVYDPSLPTLGRVAYGEATVGPGVEFPNVANLVTYVPSGTAPLQGVSLDVGAKTIKLVLPISSEGTTDPGGSYYEVLKLLDSYAPRISGVEVLATNDPNFTDALLTFTPHSIIASGTGTGGVRPSDQPLYYELGVQFEHKVHVQANNDGTHLITGLANDQQINSHWYDTMTGGGVHETFVFKPHFGQDEITDFILGGRQHDVISLSSSEFSSAAQVLQHTQDVNGSAVIHVSPTDTITIDGVTKADLIAHPQDVVFHLAGPGAASNVPHGGYHAPYNPQPYHYHVSANAGPPPYNPYTDPVVQHALGIS